MCWPQTFFSDNFPTTFRVFLLLAVLMALTFELHFGRFFVTLTWRSNMAFPIFALSAKNGLTMKWKANVSIALLVANVTIEFDLGRDIDLEFFCCQIWNLLYLDQKWSNCHEIKRQCIQWTLGLKCDFKFDLGHDLDHEFYRPNIGFAIP